MDEYTTKGLDVLNTWNFLEGRLHVKPMLGFQAEFLGELAPNVLCGRAGFFMVYPRSGDAGSG